MTQNYDRRIYDRLQWGQNTLELPKILDPIECKIMIRCLNATDSKELNNYNIQSSFSLFDDSNYQNKIERIQTPFRVKKLNNQTFMTMIILLTPEDTPITDTISAHNQEKTINFSLVKRI